MEKPHLFIIRVIPDQGKEEYLIDLLLSSTIEEASAQA